MHVTRVRLYGTALWYVYFLVIYPLSVGGKAIWIDFDETWRIKKSDREEFSA